LLFVKHINSPSIDEAASEVLSNINLLVIAGYVEEAHRLSCTMLESGPWEVNPHTGRIDYLQRTHQLLCWLLEKECPPIGGRQEASVKAFPDIAAGRWSSVLDMLVISDRLQIGEAGEGWCDVYFKSLEEMKTDNGIYKEYGKFINNVDWVLKTRLRRKIDHVVPNLFPEEFGRFETLYKTDEEIVVSPDSDSYDSHWLSDKVAECMDIFRKNEGFKTIGYMEERIFKMQLVIDIIDCDKSSTLEQMKRLMLSESLSSFLEIGYWSEFKNKILAFDFRIITDLDDNIVTDYLSQFGKRNVTTSLGHSEATSSNPHSYIAIGEFNKLCKETCLEGLDFIELAFPESDQTAILTKIPKDATLAFWQAARSLLEQTNRWPIISLDWSGSGDDWKANIRSDSFFDRSTFQQEIVDGDRTGISPTDISNGANTLDLSDHYRRMAMKSYDNVEEFLSYQVDDEGDENPALMSRVIQNLDDSDKDQFRHASYLFYKWMYENNKLPKLDTSYITWFEPDDQDLVYLILLPTRYSWEVPAFMQWYGAERCGSEVVVAQLKEWHEQYGVEMVAHYGTMLQSIVDSRPRTFDESLDLAYIQDLLATSTLSGTSIGEYALDLMLSDKWFLHDRP